MKIYGYTKTKTQRIYNSSKRQFKNILGSHKKASEPERQVPVCLYRKNPDGTITQATMTEGQMRACHISAKLMALFFGITFPMGMIKTIAEDISVKAKFMEELPTKLVAAVDSAKANILEKDSIIFDTELPIPAKFEKVIKNPKTAGAKFYQSLRTNKNSLIRDLGIDEAKYNMLSSVAMKIADQETKLGASTAYKIYDKIESLPAGRDIASGARNVLKGDGTLSLGLTQMKIDFLSDEEKILLSKYGITYGNNGSNINKPENAAVATIIHLARLDKDYDQYLKSVREIKVDTENPEIQRAIKNAQKIIFNRFNSAAIMDMDTPTKKEKALMALTRKNDTFREAFSLWDAGISKSDLDDLRKYAASIELSEPAYLAARWRGISIVPDGTKKDIACANLMNIITQRGYVANIDKYSQIPY